MKGLDNVGIQFGILITQGTLLWQTILKAKSAKLDDLPTFISVAFRNALEYRNTHKARAKRNELAYIAIAYKFGGIWCSNSGV